MNIIIMSIQAQDTETAAQSNIINTLRAGVQQTCGSRSGMSVVVSNSHFLCGKGSNYVTFRALLTTHEPVNTSLSLVSCIESWINSTTDVNVLGLNLNIIRDCPVQISALDESQCTNHEVPVLLENDCRRGRDTAAIGLASFFAIFLVASITVNVVLTVYVITFKR